MIVDSPKVVLDACVLYPAELRNLMMWLAVHEVIRPKWSAQIHEEWMRNVLKDRPDLTRRQLERTRRLMDLHGGDCLVFDFEKHIPELKLPDPDDRHVLAAAIESGADAIVTWNVTDFPEGTVGEFGIEIQTPDAMVRLLAEQTEECVVKAMRDHRASLKSPPFTPAEYLDNLKRQGLAESVEILEHRADEI